MASGVDPQQSILFNQSQVSAHAEMAWLFNTVARVGWMYRMTQFKDKAGKNTENVSLGLLAYPALSLNVPRYQVTAVPALALGAAWLAARLAARLSSRRAAGLPSG